MNKYKDWNMPGFAPIIDIESFANRRDFYDLIVMTSGGFAPVHAGHQSCFVQSAAILKQRLHDTYGQNGRVVVVVNGDSFLQRKRGAAFQDLQTRCLVVAGCKGVDLVIPYESNDDTVIDAIRLIKPTIFTKGGDRVDRKTIPEWEVCEENGVEILTGVGMTKQWSSSDFLAKWDARRK